MSYDWYGIICEIIFLSIFIDEINIFERHEYIRKREEEECKKNMWKMRIKSDRYQD